MALTLQKKIREDTMLRTGFFSLAESVFGISFRDWYAEGNWTDRYIPYALAENGRVVSNVSVNLMDFSFQGMHRRYVQLGTVMTDPGYRGRGLSRILMEEAIRDYREKCDALYLFANETVLGFYPKFGFRQAEECRLSVPVTPEKAKRRRLDLSKEADRTLFLSCYQRSNPYSDFAMIENPGLLLFHCSFLQDCVFYFDDWDVAVVTQQEGKTLTCYDIYGRGELPLQRLLAMSAVPGVQRAVLGFTPIETENMTQMPPTEDDNLFLLDGKENLFLENRMMFPLLSHA